MLFSQAAARGRANPGVLGRRGRWVGQGAGCWGWVSGQEQLLLPVDPAVLVSRACQPFSSSGHNTEERLEGAGRVRLLDIQILYIPFHLLRATWWMQEGLRPFCEGFPTHITVPTQIQCEGDQGRGSAIREPDMSGPFPMQAPSLHLRWAPKADPRGRIPSLKTPRGDPRTWPSGGYLSLPLRQGSRPYHPTSYLPLTLPRWVKDS